MEGTQNVDNIHPFSEMSLYDQYPLEINDISDTVWGATNVDDPAVNSHQGEASNIDPKKLKRMISNRLSAKKSREKKTKYLADLESKGKAIQVEIAVVEPKIASAKIQNRSLLLERESLRQQAAILQNETYLKKAEIEKLRGELNMMRKIHRQQEHLKQKMLNWNTSAQQMLIVQVSNSFSNPYHAPTQSQMWIPDVSNEKNMMNLALPNNTGLMEMNMTSQNAQNPNLNHHFP